MKKICILLCTVVFSITGCATFQAGAKFAESDDGSSESVSNYQTEEISTKSEAFTIYEPLYDQSTKGTSENTNSSTPYSDTEDPRMASIAAEVFDSSMSEYDKVQAIHDYLVINVDYDYENLENDTLPEDAFTAEGALLKNSAVCEGYAKAFSYLCDQAGLESELVYGIARDDDHEEYHAWNQVCVDGLWYNIDVTWDDPFLNGENITDGSNMIYDFFLVPDSEFEQTHFPDSTEGLHACTSSIYIEENRKRTIASYLSEPYTFVSTDEESEEAVRSYLSDHTNQFQIVYDAASDQAEAKMNVVLEQVTSTMEALELYGQVSIEVQYGLADYAIISVIMTQ